MDGEGMGYRKGVRKGNKKNVHRSEKIKEGRVKSLFKIWREIKCNNKGGELKNQH